MRRALLTTIPDIATALIDACNSYDAARRLAYTSDTQAAMQDAYDRQVRPILADIITITRGAA